MPLQCSFCLLQLDSAGALATHNSMHIEGSKRPFHCTLCSYSGNGKQKLAVHMGTHRRGILYYCAHCPFVASNTTAHTRHNSIHQTQKIPNSEITGFQNNLAESKASSEEMNDENGFSTPKVDYNNNNDNNALQTFLQPEISIQVQQEILYACPTCNFNTTSSIEIEEHLDEAEDDDLYTCDECDLTFCSFQSLTKHQETHLEENVRNSSDFQSNLLENPLRKESSLDVAFQNQSLEISNGPTMLLDPEEGFSFSAKPPTRRSRLLSRDTVRLVPSKSGSKDSTSLPNMVPQKGPGTAARSKKKAKASGKLKSSNKTSSTCMFCNKVFGCPSSLNLHVRIHTGDKPFKCPKCSFSSCQKGNLKTHLTRHAGVLVKCQFCNYTGTCTSTVNAHVRADHPDANKLRLQAKAAVWNPGPSILRKNRKPTWIPSKFRSKSLAMAVRKYLSQLVKQEPPENIQHVDEPRTLNEIVRIPNKGFHCNLCNITCKSVENFQRHNCTQKIYGCSQCSYSAKTMYHLKRHCQTHKSGVLESCPDCSYKISSSRGLAKHFSDAGHGKKFRAEISSTF